METLRIEGTNMSPRVSFEPDRSLLEISGYSRPENARDFYMKILDWLTEYKVWLEKNGKANHNSDPVTFKFKYIYFNSSTAKFIYDIILLLSEYKNANIPLKIYWYFDEDDDELREAGEELSEMANVPFQYVEISR